MPDSPLTDNEEQEREQVEALLAVLERAGKGRRPVLHVGCVAVLCVALGVLTVCGAGAAGIYAWIPILIAVGFMWLTSRLATSENQRRLLVTLTAYDDIRIIGPLISAYYWPDMEMHAVTIAEALIRLLPRMKASDANLLNDKQRESLRRALGSRDDAFVLAILKALEQIGDNRDLKVVQHLANRRAWTPRQKAIKEAAEACLPNLKTRLERSGNILLRVTDDHDESLLRPASNSDNADKETLLRPDSSNTGDDAQD